MYNKALRVCSGFRPDFHFCLPGWWLIIELDENQHNTYDKHDETERMRTLAEEAGQPTVFIRFNPDKYKMGKVLQKIDVAERYAVLLERIQYHLAISFEERNVRQAKRLVEMNEAVTPENLCKHLTPEYLYYDDKFAPR